MWRWTVGCAAEVAFNSGVCCGDGGGQCCVLRMWRWTVECAAEVALNSGVCCECGVEQWGVLPSARDDRSERAHPQLVGLQLAAAADQLLIILIGWQCLGAATRKGCLLRRGSICVANSIVAIIRAIRAVRLSRVWCWSLTHCRVAPAAAHEVAYETVDVHNQNEDFHAQCSCCDSR